MATTGKKAVPKKAAPKASRAAGGKAPARSAAREELEALLPELDEEGIAFLLEQARTHRYNMEVERLNEVASRTIGRGGAGPVAEGAPAGGGLLRPGAEPGLRIERSADGSTYHIVAGGAWKMFSAEEMAALVRMTREPDPEAEVGRRLYAWMERERMDALSDLGVAKASSPIMAELVRVLRKTFPAAGAKGRARR